MSLDALIMLFGGLIAVTPFLGFTIAMQMWIIFAFGIIVIALGIAVRRRGEREVRSRRRGEFVESAPAEPVRRSSKAREVRITTESVENNKVDDSING
jgi:Flp pilus assembly protein TadB